MKNEFVTKLWAVVFFFPMVGLSLGLGVGLLILAVAVALRWAGW